MRARVRARAHGRVNLIGEHTDYNGGWVLPTTIPQYTEVELRELPGDMVSLMSEPDGNGHLREAHYKLGEEKPDHSWRDYLQGATKLVNQVLPESRALSGFEARITSTIPEGSGLSSSAALEISFLKALREFFQLPLDDLVLARLGQRIENEFVGARVGIMDQMATCFGTAGVALFLDTMTLQFETVRLPLDRMDLLVINSGVTHRLSETDGGYNQRRKECEVACNELGVKILRELSLSELRRSSISGVLLRRARHVISENARVKQAVEALKASDLKWLGELFVESHASMRDDFEISTPEIDCLVNLCLDQREVFGARLTGGGFGGSVIAISEKGAKEKIAATVIALYQARTGKQATLLV